MSLYDDLSPEEIEIVRRLRQLPYWKREAVVASETSFMNWLRESVIWVWNKVSGYARDLWQWFRGLF